MKRKVQVDEAASESHSVPKKLKIFCQRRTTFRVRGRLFLARKSLHKEIVRHMKIAWHGMKNELMAK